MKGGWLWSSRPRPSEEAEHNVDADRAIGWPEEWDEWSDGYPMPGPLCHPDYVEIGEWMHLGEFEALL